MSWIPEGSWCGHDSLPEYIYDHQPR